MSKGNIITNIRRDVAVAKAVVNADLALTPAILKSLWVWFQDIEVAVPLPVMSITSGEQIAITRDILVEMDEHFLILEQKVTEAIKADVDFDGPASPEGKKVDLLWKELAGCYAADINKEVPILPEHMQEMITIAIVDEISRRYDISEEDARFRLRSEPSLRMMVRMSGLDPDNI
jgi:hypothetical protein